MDGDDARQRARDRLLLEAGGGVGCAIERPVGTVGVNVFRAGLRPIGIGGVYLAPLWFFRRMRWQLGSQGWSVEVRTGRRRVLATVVSVDDFDSKADAVDHALRAVERARDGAYDEDIPS